MIKVDDHQPFMVALEEGGKYDVFYVVFIFIFQRIGVLPPRLSVPCSHAHHVGLPFALGCQSQHSIPVWVRSVTWLLTLHCLSAPHE